MKKGLFHSQIRLLTARGFTLIELIIVIAVLAIISGVYLYEEDGKEVGLRAYAEQIASEIRYVQNLGFTKGARYRINFATHCTGGTSPSCYWFSNLNNTVRIDNPKTNTTEITLPSDITLSSTNSMLIFNGKGIPFIDTAGNVLTSNAVITLSSPGETSRTVTVSPQTGRVVIQ